jgi:hypothetical protein
MPRFIPNNKEQDQQYLYEKYGIPPVSPRQKRNWILNGLYPKPVQISPGRLAFTDEQLDDHAEAKLSLAKNSAPA